MVEQGGRRDPAGRRWWLGLVLAFLLGAATWAAWLGWDTEYYWDAEIGAYQGPYRPAQVVGCALTFAAVVALLTLRWPSRIVVAGTVLGFWLPWTVQAVREDESGLAVVGSLMLLVGLAVGAVVVNAVTRAVRDRVSRRDRRSGPS
ncbi:hypothetical protein GCM10009584_27830 [Ornithinimicrobium humiphilum]|uniref:Uncharacterized protein n=1 Tax=Ornithinimicrobium humiphilum TaxID=125288 RepID=A0A543KNZ3_9MICO|nr:hypothetical protein [Ornithinimicrobium humiphilum]TQM96799.1 hypothetical protein FB476_1690 [Ornithinimicrobium humiphilum]